MKSKDQIASINGRYAYIHKNGGKPINSEEQMLPNKQLICQPLDEQWRKLINADKWWASGYTGIERGTQSDMALIKKLLMFGGYEACVQYQDEDAVNIMERGQLWYGDHLILMKGAPSQCHSNACNLWQQNRFEHEIAIATGYALTKDGIWRQHSWLLLRKSRSVQVIETTMKRIAYVGYVMTKEEAERFCSDNL